MWTELSDTAKRLWGKTRAYRGNQQDAPAIYINKKLSNIKRLNNQI